MRESCRRRSRDGRGATCGRIVPESSREVNPDGSAACRIASGPGVMPLARSRVSSKPMSRRDVDPPFYLWIFGLDANMPAMARSLSRANECARSLAQACPRCRARRRRLVPYPPAFAEGQR